MFKGTQLQLEGAMTEEETKEKTAAKRGRPRNEDRVQRGDKRIDTWVDKAFHAWFERIRQARGSNTQDLAREALRRGLRTLARELDESSQGAFPFVPPAIAAAAMQEPAPQPVDGRLREKFQEPAPGAMAAPNIPRRVRGQFDAHQAERTTPPKPTTSSAELEPNDLIATLAAAVKLGRAACSSIHSPGDKTIPDRPPVECMRVMWLDLAELGTRDVRERCARALVDVDVEKAFVEAWAAEAVALRNAKSSSSRSSAKQSSTSTSPSPGSNVRAYPRAFPVELRVERSEWLTHQKGLFANKGEALHDKWSLDGNHRMVRLMRRSSAPLDIERDLLAYIEKHELGYSYEVFEPNHRHGYSAPSKAQKMRDAKRATSSTSSSRSSASTKAKRRK